MISLAVVVPAAIWKIKRPGRRIVSGRLLALLQSGIVLEDDLHVAGAASACLAVNYQVAVGLAPTDRRRGGREAEVETAGLFGRWGPAPVRRPPNSSRWP